MGPHVMRDAERPARPLNVADYGLTTQDAGELGQHVTATEGSGGRGFKSCQPDQCQPEQSDPL